MPHPLVLQLRFTRSEFHRALKGVSDEDACQRIMPMNCISWNVGHLAWQEQEYFMVRARREPRLYPEIEKMFAYGAPASTPSLKEMIATWKAICKAVDPWLDTLTSKDLQSHALNADGTPSQRIIGALMQRMIYHYWYHTGENMAIRQMLGHTKLPQFVGSIDEQAPYTPESN